MMEGYMFWSVANVILMDLVLGADNAVVIAMACRHLPPAQQRKAVFWGILGAIFIRTAMAIAAVQLLRLPLLKLAGGVMLLWMAFKLLAQKGKDGVSVQPGNGLWGAVQTILLADTIMGVDNILAIAGAAHGDPRVVLLGLIVSIPFILWGARVFLHWLERYPLITYLGAGMIAWTAGMLMAEDEFAHRFFQYIPFAGILTPLLGILFVLIFHLHFSFK